MLFIEEVILLFLFFAFIATLSLTLFGMIKSHQTKQKVKQELKEALSSNSKKRLEDILILHDKDLDKDTKEKIRIKIDDFLITEDDKRDEERFQSLK